MNRSISIVTFLLVNVATVASATDLTSKSAKAHERANLVRIEQFANEFEQAFHARDADRVTKHIAWERIAKRAVMGLQGTPEYLDGLRAGIVDSGQDKQVWAKKIFNELEANGHYRLVTAIQNGEGYRAIFCLNGECGLNYHEYLIELVDEEPIVVDIYICLAGERISDTVNRRIALASSSTSSNWLQKLFKDRVIDDKLLKKFSEVSTVAHQGNYEEARKLYNALPEAMQADKLLLLSLHKAALLSDNKHGAMYVIEKIINFHEGDPMLDLLLLDKYAIEDRYDKCLPVIDRLDERIGGDPFLDTYRSYALFSSGRLEEALAKANAAVMALPEVEECFWALVDAQLALNKYPAAADTMHRLESEHDIEFGNLRNVESYEGFVESPAGLKWLESHPQSRAEERPSHD